MLEKENLRNIALIGFSTTGKSKVAQKVAGYLGWGFIDTDDEIVRLSGKSIPEIFEQDGEDKFRKLERSVLEKACGQEKVIIATGGGVILNPQNRELLVQSSTVVCLEAKVETIYQRLLQDTLYSDNPVVRPLLTGDNPLDQIRNIKSSRQPYYAIADWVVSTDNLTIDEVCQEVIRGWHYTNRSHMNKDTEDTDIACVVETASRQYPVYVGWGLLDKLGDKMRQMGLSGKAVVISDQSVFSIYGTRSTQSLGRSGFEVKCCTVPAGEATKNIKEAINIYDFLVENHVERNDVIVALGGGMVGDLAGFVAATYLRGIPFIQVPTSLMAMVDASIGGKVAVDHEKGKNLIGAFYQPIFVLADVRCLTSLPQRELTSGWSEVIKHGLILDAVFFGLLEENVEKLMGLEPDITSKVIADSVRIKAQVVSEDEKEIGKRMILNYGHTVAHGLEAASEYRYFLHGEAVAIGMTVAARLSERMGLISYNAVQRQQELLQKFNLPIQCSGINIPVVLEAMQLDKKVRNKVVRWILLEAIGKAVVRTDVSDNDILEILQGVCKS